MVNMNLFAVTFFALLVRAAADEVCAGLTEQANGICNSYCVSQKCHITPPPGNSCNSLRENWFKATGETLLPCEIPITEAPTTEAPTTEAPTTEAPTTEAPTTTSPTDSPTDAPTTDSPTPPPTTRPPTPTGFEACPCWTFAYLQDVADFFLDAPFLPVRYASGPGIEAHADIGNHQTFEELGLRLTTGEIPSSPTGYYCTDWANDLVVDYLEFDDYQACEADVLLLMEQFDELGVGLCEPTLPAASECPCWAGEGLPDLPVTTDSFASSGWNSPTHLKQALFTMQDDFSELLFEALALTDGTYYCSKTITGESMEVALQITEAQFHKCYNDALQKSYARGVNLCSVFA